MGYTPLETGTLGDGLAMKRRYFILRLHKQNYQIENAIIQAFSAAYSTMGAKTT